MMENLPAFGGKKEGLNFLRAMLDCKRKDCVAPLRLYGVPQDIILSIHDGAHVLRRFEKRGYLGAHCFRDLHECRNRREDPAGLDLGEETLGKTASVRDFLKGARLPMPQSPNLAPHAVIRI